MKLVTEPVPIKGNDVKLVQLLHVLGKLVTVDGRTSSGNDVRPVQPVQVF